MNRAAKVFERQGYHLLGYILLGGILYWATRDASGRALGAPVGILVRISWALAGVFQFGAALVWRIQLYVRPIGRVGYRAFATMFPILILTRMLLIIPSQRRMPPPFQSPRCCSGS